MKRKEKKVALENIDDSNPKDLMVKVEHVYKRYRLGLIGGGTLTSDLQSWWARIRHKPDPTLKIGEKKHNKNEIFYALKDINFEVKKGEAIGIIGSNGAGKSTILKLISQVTAPTDGKIYLNGRVTSMLEVGTGFHGELTGRENIYINGAILGMTKKEIDAKVEEIIEFSEVRQFIDTPVKRYSSGMYVKLAFSVAAHLDSEIVIMDEVLAVGDINFQQKCIRKMREIAHQQGRTVLYVSHNMATIKALCDRCIVLNKGTLIFDGDVDEAIEMYSKKEKESILIENDLASKNRIEEFSREHNDIFLTKATVNKCEGNELSFTLEYDSKKEFKQLVLRSVILTSLRNPIATSYSKPFAGTKIGSNSVDITIDISMFVNDVYKIDLIISDIDENDTLRRHDVVNSAFSFEISDHESDPYNVKWMNSSWGRIRLHDSDSKYDKN